MALAEDRRLTAITIGGFKSIAKETTLELGALNVLAGANSGGKSSFIQPLLLLKQTLESDFDPGPLLINGPNVKFTQLNQMFSIGAKPRPFSIGLTNVENERLTLVFDKNEKNELSILENRFFFSDDSRCHKNFLFALTPFTSKAELKKIVEEYEPLSSNFGDNWGSFKITRHNPFLKLESLEFGSIPEFSQQCLSLLSASSRLLVATFQLVAHKMLHVPGLRSSPERNYPKTAISGSLYKGRFDIYVASIIAHWQENQDPRLNTLTEQLQLLGLTSQIQAKKINDAEIELQVGRLPNTTKSKQDLVSIADVGFGVSQVLPVLVALLVAEQGQVVYIEQPETHLHPKAQRALAGIFAEAAQKKATIIVETHSSLFLLALQTLVAKNELDKNLLKLHWVERDKKGYTKVSTADLDKTGAYGDWPQDFDKTEREADLAYIEAAEKVLFGS
jgi:AAA15 family ATPase/GTPase